MMNRLRCPLAQICQRARAKPSQPRKAMIPGTSGRFNLDHSDGGLCRRDLSSSDVDVSCNRKPPPWLSQREGKFLVGRAQLTRATPYAVTGCDEYHSLARMTSSPKDVVAAVPKSGTPETSSALPAAPAGGEARSAVERAPDRGVSARGLLPAAAVALAVALLFLAYLRVSRTYPENSDESNDLLMAWDMLHGNVLLHGWYLSDVSFITTELPQYLMLERFSGLHTDTAHIAAAMTYTLVVVLAVLLARGRAGQGQASAGEAAPRMLLTAGLMFAPQLGVGVFVLLLSLGHIGTAVPLMLTWLVIDRLRPRWWVPPIVRLLSTWVLVADPLLLVVGIVPLVAVAAMRVARELALARRRDGREPGWARASLRARWYELSLAAAAILADGLASLVTPVLPA